MSGIGEAAFTKWSVTVSKPIVSTTGAEIETGGSEEEGEVTSIPIKASATGIDLEVETNLSKNYFLGYNFTRLSTHSDPGFEQMTNAFSFSYKNDLLDGKRFFDNFSIGASLGFSVFDVHASAEFCNANGVINNPDLDNPDEPDDPGEETWENPDLSDSDGSDDPGEETWENPDLDNKKKVTNANLRTNSTGTVQEPVGIESTKYTFTPGLSLRNVFGVKWGKHVRTGLSLSLDASLSTNFGDFTVYQYGLSAGLFGEYKF